MESLQKDVNGQSIFDKSEWAKPNARSTLAPNNFSSDDLLPKAQAYKDINDKTLVFKDNLYNEFDDVKLKEETDKYIIHFKDNEISKKELKVDFNKEQNELSLKITEKKINEVGEDVYICNYESNIKFDKAVKFDEIVPDIQNGKVEICIPKVHKDSDNLLSMSLKNTSIDAFKRY
ncbi:small heat shock protein 21 [[Candida] jaroonii]|uniref:Small heat shock protein 21 n=1 Tax=[Candida] jaroonii TaxID=467808 RepID=A0ACA9Y028_9ASCO|nr:small heat shock protein 21 [[Candida] jaroonii]